MRVCAGVRVCARVFLGQKGTHGPSDDRELCEKKRRLQKEKEGRSSDRWQQGGAEERRDRPGVWWSGTETCLVTFDLRGAQKGGVAIKR